LALGAHEIMTESAPREIRRQLELYQVQLARILWHDVTDDVEEKSEGH
jgi:hypothetical protein